MNYMFTTFWYDLHKARAAWTLRLSSNLETTDKLLASALADVCLAIELMFEVLLGPCLSFLFYKICLILCGTLFADGAWQPGPLSPLTWAVQYCLQDFVFYIGHASQHGVHTFGIDWSILMANHLNHHAHTSRTSHKAHTDAFYVFSNIVLESPVMLFTAASIAATRGLGWNGVVASLLQSFVSGK